MLAGNQSESDIYTPISDNTNSEEVLQLARFWLKRCVGPEHPACPDESFGSEPRYYPTRLIELPPYDSDLNPFHLHTESAEAGGDSTSGIPSIWGQRKKGGEETVRLVKTQDKIIQPYLPSKYPPKRKYNRSETQSHPNRKPQQDDSQTNGPVDPQNNTSRPNADGEERNNKDPSKNREPRGEYVTLSHCWGAPSLRIIRLIRENEVAFMTDGIPLKALPLTFRQAIDFARRLSEDIRYIWIDSLCILQDDLEDWEREGLQMYSVYRNSYCNISATAAGDSTIGLHNKRDPQHLWEEEISLNTEGIPRPLTKASPKRTLGLQALVKRCRLQDASFWDRHVDDAPVNRRAWVLQERLLAPRVLHFCKEQIAWECGHVDAAESLPHGISDAELRSGRITKRSRLKGLISEDYGEKPLVSDDLEKSNEAHECWKRVVERYSTTSLTKPEDKLIALAGIAEHISKRIGKDEYVVGMFGKYLASQLLWRVNPKYEDEMYKYPQRRAPKWRAPTFSWAAVDAPQGIKCGETFRERELQISVVKIHIQHKDPRRRFGLIIEDYCYLDLSCTLVKISIHKSGTLDGTTTGSTTEQTIPYFWQLEEGGQDIAKPKSELSNLYLDSVHDDFKEIQDLGETYCIPAYEKTLSGIGQLVCLLVQLLKDHNARGGSDRRVFRRIGIAAVPEFQKDSQNAIWEAAKSKRETIRLT